MSESPAERFRRIVEAWREEKDATAPERRGTAAPAPEPSAPAAPRADTPPSGAGAQRLEQVTPLPVEIPPLDPAPSLDEFKTPADARHFLERLRAKTAQIVQDFAGGKINQRQFQAVYSHYQRQRLEVEEALIEMPGSGAWRAVAVEGHTSFLRQQHAAQVLSYALYETASGISLAQVGDFSVDPALLMPMLSSFRSITQELFGAGMRRTEIKGGHWLYFVPGRYTTLVVIYSAEPAAIQLKTIEDLHRDFELVNELTLSSGDVSQLAFTFTHLWAFEDPTEV